MAFASGKASQFTIDNSSGTPTDISAYCTSTDLDQQLAALDTTTYGATGSSKTYVSGLRDGKFSVNGNFDPTLDSLMNGTLAANAAGTTLPTASVVYGPIGPTTGNPKYTCEVIVTDYKVASPVAGIVTWTATCQISGQLTRTVY